MKTKFFTILLAFITLTAFAQKKEIRNAESAVEDGKYEDAKALLKEVENTYTEENEKWQSTYLITKGKAYLGNVESLETPLEELKIAANAFLEAKKLGNDKDIIEQGLVDVKTKFVNSALEDQEQEKHLVASNKLYEAYELQTDTLYLYYAAASAVNGKDYETAIEYYNQLLDMNYDGSELLLQATNVETKEVENFPNKTIRKISIQNGTHKDAVDTRTPSKKGQIAKNVSLIYIELDQPEKAKESIKHAKLENPDDVGLMQAEANLYYNMGDIETYNKIMKEISELSPDDPNVLFNLGISSEQLEDYDSARKFYEKAIEIDPTYANAYNNLASIILAEERTIIEKMNGLTMSAEDTKKYDELKARKIEVIKEAVPYLKKSIELDPENVNAMKILRSIYSQTGDNAKAQEMDIMIKKKE